MLITYLNGFLTSWETQHDISQWRVGIDKERKRAWPTESNFYFSGTCLVPCML